MVILLIHFTNFNGNYTADGIRNLIMYYGYFIKDFEKAESYSVRKLEKYITYLNEINEIREEN